MTVQEAIEYYLPTLAGDLIANIKAQNPSRLSAVWKPSVIEMDAGYIASTLIDHTITWASSIYPERVSNRGMYWQQKFSEVARDKNNIIRWDRPPVNIHDEISKVNSLIQQL